MWAARNLVWGILVQVTFVTFQFVYILHLSEESLLESSEEFNDYRQSNEPEIDAEWFFTKGLFRINNDNSNRRLPDEAYLPKIESVSIKSKIRFRYARTRVTTTITNPHEKISQTVDFSVRIPKEAFITLFQMRVDGEEVIKANVTRVEEARELYNAAMAERRSVTLGLLENKNADFENFSMKFIVGAGKRVMFVLQYDERLQRKFNTYEHVIHVVPDYLVTDKTRYRIEVLIEEDERAKNVKAFKPNGDTSSYPGSCENTYQNSSIELTRQNATRIVWQNVDETENHLCRNWTGEFGVSYSLEDIGPAGHVLLRDGYFVHFFAPPDLQPLRKHVVFVLDKSDSMEGYKLEQMKEAMTNILDSLGSQDFFNLIAFSNNVEIWNKYNGHARKYLFPFPVNYDNKDAALGWMSNRISAGGSTNIHLALQKALELCKNVTSTSLEEQTPVVKLSKLQFLSPTLPKGVKSMIIFLTDGDPTSGIVSKPHILRAIKLANYELNVPIYSLAFGKEPDFQFLTQLSLKNKGFARQIYENADAGIQLSDFYAEISSPVLSNVTFEYVASSKSTSSPDRNIFDSFVKPGYFPMIFDGTEVVIARKLSEAEDAEFSNRSKYSQFHVSVSGNTAKGVSHYEVPVTDCRYPGACRGNPGIDDLVLQKLYIYMSIQKRIGSYSGSKTMYSEDDPCTNYESEWQDIESYNTMVQNCTETRLNQAIDDALKYGFVIPGTAAVMKTRSIRELEMDVATEQGEEWEVFLGSEIPAAPGSKQLSSKPAHGRFEERYVVPEMLPQAEALTSSLKFQEPQGFLRPLRYAHESLKRGESGNLTLRDISWLSHVDLSKPVSSFSMANQKGSNISYLIASEGWLIEHRHILEVPQDWHLSNCRGGSPNKTCTHLANCIMDDFRTNFTTYRESYWCPMRLNNGLYLGTCCSNRPSTVTPMKQ